MMLQSRAWIREFLKLARQDLNLECLYQKQVCYRLHHGPCVGAMGCHHHRRVRSLISLRAPRGGPAVGLRPHLRATGTVPMILTNRARVGVDEVEPCRGCVFPELEHLSAATEMPRAAPVPGGPSPTAPSTEDHTR